MSLIDPTEEQILTDEELHKRIAVMNAVWLSHYEGDERKRNHTDLLIKRAAHLLRMQTKDLKEYINTFNYDWVDRVFCSRPTNWNAIDSLQCLKK